MRIRSDIRRDIAAWARIGLAAWVGCSSESVPAPAPTHEAGAPFDAGLDGSLDAQGPSEAGCYPGNVSGFKRIPVPPINPVSNACAGFFDDGGLVLAYGDACLGHQATYETCAAFGRPDAAAAAACFDCLTSPERPDASSYGVVVGGPAPVVNYTGCILALDPTSEGASCAQSLSSAYQCVEYACTPNCPVTGNPSQAAFTQCTNVAWFGACSGDGVPAQDCTNAEQADSGSPVAAVCFGGQTAEDHYLTVARHFCGGG